MKAVLQTFFLLLLLAAAGSQVANAASLTVLNGNDSGAGSLRATITAASPGDTVIFSNTLDGQTLTLTSGVLLINKNLTIDASALANGFTISGNNASRIFETTFLTNVTMTGLTLTAGQFSYGGAILSNQATALTLNDMTFTGNHASGQGGAIFNSIGTLTIRRSTFTGNTAMDVGGAIANDGPLTIDHSTFTGNQVSGSGYCFGGAIFDFGKPVVLTHCTITGNSSVGFTSGLGGGLRTQGGTLTLENTLIAGNLASHGSNDIGLFNGTILTGLGRNLIGDNSSVTAQFPAGPLVGTAASPLAPMLAALGNYGGRTQTMPPLLGSPAIDPAGGATSSAFATDQRGYSRVLDGNDPPDGTATVDVGAVEYRVPVFAIVVANNNSSGAGSLRQAIADIGSGGTITFASALNGGTITLGDHLNINQDVTIDASSLPQGLTINTNNHAINPSGAALTLDSLDLSGGGLSEYIVSVVGGGNMQLTLLNCTIRDSVWGISLFSAVPVTISNCTFTNNSGNAFYYFGNGGVARITNTTIVGNTGDGICLEGGEIILKNSIVANNGTEFDLLNGNPGTTLTNAGGNLIGDNTGVATDFPAGPLVGTAASPLNPLLATLGYYGGPTKTMPPQFGSPAINAGGATTLLTDQRGFPRVIGGTVDIGAVEAGSANFNPDGLTLTTQGVATLTKLEISTDPNFLNTVGTFAGTGSTVFTDGPRDTATFNHPSGVAEDDAGNLYVADTGNHRIRKIDKSTGEVSTIAGTGAFGFADGNGLTTAKFAFPAAVAVTADGGIVYVSDTINHRIRKLTKPAVIGQPWMVTTLAGTGVAGINAGADLADVAGSVSQFNHPHGLILDTSGNLFVADSFNHRIRKVTPGGVTSTYAGTGSAGANDFQTIYPNSATVSGGNSVVISRTPPSITGSLGIARSYSTSTVLSNGKVLVAGGSNGISGVLASAELYNPADGTWTATGSLATARDSHSATVLPNGKVLVVGGNNPVSGGARASVELYDPVAGTWSATGSLANARKGHSATLLPSGKVLVAGGSTNTGALASAELYDPVAGTWSATGSLATARENSNAILLSNGKVLVAGGFNGNISGSALATAELYDPVNGTWSAAGSLAVSRFSHTTTLLANGKVLVAGGMNNGFSTALASAEIYDPVAGTWSATGSLAMARAYYTATILSSGEVLAVGGIDGNFDALAGVELFDPAAGTWSNIGSLATGRSSHMAVILPNSKLLIAGGEDVNFDALVSAELLDASIADTANLIQGMSVSGPNIAPGTTVAAITDETTFVLSTPATGTGSGLSLTVGTAVHKQHASFNVPSGLVFDSSENLFVADRGNHRVRRIDKLSGMVTNFAGSGMAGFAEGTGTAAQLNTPVALAIDGDNNLYVSDQDNHAIRKITSTGVVTTVAGNGTAGFVDGNSTAARFNGPSGLLVDADGFLIVADTKNNRLRRVAIEPLTVDTTYIAGTVAGTGTLTAEIDAIALGLNPGQTYYFRWLPQGGGTPVAGSSFQVLLPPTVVTNPATEPTSTGGQLNATVNPQGSNTEVIFEYSTDPQLHGPWQVSSLPPGSLTDPQGVAVFNGITYVADQAANAIYTVDALGVATLFAGAANGAPGFVDGTYTAARFDSPTGLAVDTDGNLFVADRLNHCIRKITPGGEVSTHGSGLAGFADGSSTSARFLFPQGVAVFGNNVYVADTGNHRIRRIDKDTGAVTTLAGNGTAAFADGAGTSARFSSPRGVAVNATGQLHVADTGNHAIRLLTAGNSVVTLAGDGTAGFLDGAGTSARFNSPAGLAIDPEGTLYVTDQANHRVRSISTAGLVGTVAGSGVAGLLDSPGGSLHPATAAKLDTPGGIALDADGNLIFSEETSNRLRRIDRAPLPRLETNPNLTGNSSIPVFSVIDQPLLPGATYYFRAVAINGRDEVEGEILSFTTPQSNIVVHNGPTEAAPVIVPNQVVDFGTTPFNTPVVRTFTIKNIGNFDLFVDGIALIGEPDGAVFALSGQYAEFSVAAGASSTFHVTLNHGSAGTFTKTVRIASNDLDQPAIEFSVTGTVLAPPLLTNVAASNVTALGVTFAGTVNPQGSATEVLFEYSKYPDFAGTLEVLTKSGSTEGFSNGCGGAAQYRNPSGVAVDRFGNIYVADTGNHCIRRIAANGDCVVFAGSGNAGSANGVGTAASFHSPEGLAVDAAGNIYVADTGNHWIRKITPAGVVTTLAGFGSSGSFTDGIISGARFNAPAGIAIDATGNLFIADSGNNRIRKISPAGEVSTFAGPAGYSAPKGVAVDGEGRVCVADTGNNRVVRFTATDPQITTGFNGPTGVAIDAAGLIHVADRGAHRIARIESGGGVTTLAGTSGVSGSNDGSGAEAKFNLPTGIAVSPTGIIFVADSNNHRIRQINLAARRVVAATNLVTTPENPVTLTLVGLEPSTTYYYRGIASNGGGTVFNPTTTPLTFTTLDNNAGLAELSVNGTPVPNFDPCAYSYPYTPETQQSSIVFFAETSSPDAHMQLVQNGELLGDLESGEASAPLPLVEGLNTFQIIVMSADGTNFRTYAVETTYVPTESGFAQWQALKFGANATDPLIAGALANPDKDSSNNLLEYAFDLEPNLASTVGLPFMNRDGGFFSITYRKRVGATDLDYKVQWSTDLHEWFETGIIEELATPQGVGFTEEIRAKIPDDAPSKFLRVEVKLLD